MDESKKNKDIKKQKWTKEQENLLAEWSEKAAGYRWLHTRSEKLYRRRNYSFTIPVIILSTLTGTANFAMDSFVPEENKQIAMACVGGVNIFAGILSTLQNFLRYAELMEGHRVAEVSWSKFSREISVELALEPSMRKPAFDFLNVCRAEYDRLIEQSPSIDDSIIFQYNTKFKGEKGINHPHVCNGLHKCKIYEPSEEERLSNIVAGASNKLKTKTWKKPIFENKVLNNLKPIKNEINYKEESRRELEGLVSIGKVSMLKNKVNEIENDINIESGNDSPKEKINKIMIKLNENDNTGLTDSEKKRTELDKEDLNNINEYLEINYDIENQNKCTCNEKNKQEKVLIKEEKATKEKEEEEEEEEEEINEKEEEVNILIGDFINEIEDK